MKRLTRLIPLLTFLLLVLWTALHAAEVEQPWMKPDPAAVKRWQDMRFGMFIHWGPSSITSQEISWSRGSDTPVAVYDNLYKEFNPSKFNADEWVAIAKSAGMKYIVLTTKHHDGFCLWDTKYTDYNIMNTPFKRDVVKELAEACKKQGIAFGAYYSVPDWYSPDYAESGPLKGVNAKNPKPNMDAYEKYLQNQTRELITQYGPLCTIWNDFPRFYGKERGKRTIELVRKLQPDILINNRTGAGGDYDTPEQTIGGFNTDRPWESCMTVSAHDHWSWRGADDGVKSVATCLNMLIHCTGGNGNVLLNVGPRADGIIDPAQAGVLKEMGAWLAKYGESIYGTRGGPYKPGNWGASTRRRNTIYLHITKWRGDTITLPALSKKIGGGKLIGGGLVDVHQCDIGVTLTVPVKDQQEIDTVVALTLEGSAMQIEPIIVQRKNGVVGKVTSSKNAKHGGARAFDGDPSSFWISQSKKPSWIEIELPVARKVEGATIILPSARDGKSHIRTRYDGKGIEAYEFQAEIDGKWQTLCMGEPLHAGEETGAVGILKFEPVTVQKFRLNITKVKGVVQISEIQLKFSLPGVVKASSGLASAENAFDGYPGDYPGTNWTAESNAAWIELDLPTAKKIESATIVQDIWYADRIGAYEFQAEMDGAWKTLCVGGEIGTEHVLKFKPVTAQKFRLNITKAKDAPVINEIELQ